MRYHERFVSGDAAGGSYQCFLTLSDPDGWTLSAGGPAAAFVAPAAREHGFPTYLALGESDGAPLEDAAVAPIHEAAVTTLAPKLAEMLGQSIVIERAGAEEGVDLFEEAVKAHLQQIYNTPTGQKLLNSLHASGKQTTIQYAWHDGLNRALIPKDAASINNCFYQADAITSGAGQGITVNYSPARELLGGQEGWQNRPPAIRLAHELIHAEQAAYGRMRRGQAINPGVVNKMDTARA